MKLYHILLTLSVVGLLWSCNKNEPNNFGETISEINSPVNAIVIDSENTKWIGTDNGLYRSVEGGFQEINLSVSSTVNSLLYEDFKNMLWIGTENGLVNAIISNDDFSGTSISDQKLSNPKITSFHIDKDSKRWIGTENGITLNYNDTWKKENFRINSESKTFKMTAEEFKINSIASSDGDYYFATSGAKLYRAFGYDSSVDAFTGATQWDPPYNGLSITDTMFVVFIDNEKRQWMGGKEGIQVHAGNDPKDLASFTYYYDELPDPYALTICQATNNDIWVGTRKGIAVFNGTIWRIIEDELPDLYVNAIAFDEDGSAWIGTQKGLAHIE